MGFTAKPKRIIFEKNNTTPFLIMEDDAIFRDNFIENFNTIASHLDKNWDILYLSCHYNCVKSETNHKIYKIKTRVHGAGAVIYHPKSIPIILSEIFPFQLQIDHDIPDKYILTKKLNAYIACNENNNTIIFNDNKDGSTTNN
jgi:GR25 family glycosyltransferase involved in LPS biosynthesis